MKINMQNKSIIPATMAVLVVLGAFAPGFSSVASAASFGSGPFDVIEGYNYSDQGSGKYWQEDSANASVGEVVTVKVFIKNTSDEVAEDVNVKLSTSESGDTGTITATISADNAGSISDNFKVYLDGAGEITSLDHTGYTKLYDAFVNEKSFSGSAGDVVSSSGLDIGDVAPGDSNSKFVVARFEVDGGEIDNSDKPEVTTRSATNVQVDEARLRGEVDPNGDDTEVWFEWGEGFFSLDNDTPRMDVGDGNSIVDFDEVIDNLDENDTYYFRAVARNSHGTDYGQTLNFRTGDDGGNGPEILDVDVNNIDEDSARLICEVDPNGEDTDVWFEWDEDEDDLDRGRGEETNETTVDGNESSEEVRRTITGLDEDTRYFFKCFAENRDGDDESRIHDFETDRNGGSSNGPDVATRSATDVGSTSARLNGDVDPNGENTDVWFEWGTSRSSLTRDTDEQDVGDGTRERDFDERISGLSPNTTYYFRAVAESRDGRDRGSILSFRTDGGTVTPPVIITRVVERFIEVEVEPEPELEGLIITLDADTSNIDSDEIIYVVSYDNRTDETFTDAELIIEIPNELDFIDADPREDDEDGDELFFTIGTISPGEEDSFVIETEVRNSVDENDEIEFVSNVHYTDDDTRKIVTVIDVTTLAEARRGGGFAAFLGGALADFFTNPLFWLLVLLAVIFFIYRYFANLARPREETVYVREPFQQQFPSGDSS